MSAASLDVFSIGDDPVMRLSSYPGASDASASASASASTNRAADDGASVSPSLRRLGRMPDRPAPDAGAHLRLARRAAGVFFVLFCFISLCVILSKLSGVPRPATECSDGNACTRDLRVGGGCMNVPMPDGAVCTGDPYAACYGYGGAGVPPAQPPTCARGRCVGARCAGTCARTSDCPQIRIRGVAKSASCIWNSCVYAEQAQLAVAQAQCSTPVFEALCGSLLSPATDPLARCLVVSSSCEGGQLVCIYTFACATPIAP